MSGFAFVADVAELLSVAEGVSAVVGPPIRVESIPTEPVKLPFETKGVPIGSERPFVYAEEPVSFAVECTSASPATPDCLSAAGQIPFSPGAYSELDDTASAEALLPS